jgi:TRAP-type C4-dicarboxylate transport system substrate-binding protein
MKRIIYGIGVFLLSASFAFANGGQEQKAASGGAAQTKKIAVTFAGTEAATTGQSRAMQAMADALNADGRFEASVQVNGALSGDTDALVTQAKMGVPLVIPSDPGRLASQFDIPDMNILMSPYVLTDRSLLAKLPDTELFKTWQAQLEKQGVSFVADMYNGFRCFYTIVPVKHVSDLKGLRIRGFGNAIGNALAKYFGFANIGITWGEVLPGLQQKTIDGCEVQVATAYGSAIYEVAHYLAMTKHYMLQSSFVCSTQLLKSMDPDTRAFFLKTIRDNASKYGDVVAAEEEPFYQKMKEHGMQITDVDLKEWQAAIAPLYTNNDLKFSPGLKDKLFQELGVK